MFCKKKIRCYNSGLQQILQHATGKSHIKLTEEVATGIQATIVRTQLESSSTATSGCVSSNLSTDKPPESAMLGKCQKKIMPQLQNLHVYAP